MSDPDAREDPRVTRRRRLTLVAMCIAQGMTLLDVTIVNTALPSIQRELHMTAGQLEWVISAYALSLAAFIPLGGALGDRFGRKRFFLAGMVVFTLGSVACALSTSDVALIGSRALQGAGGAFMSALTLAILTETYPVERRAGAFGMWAAISGLGFGLGPVVGGALLSVFSWSSVFWVNVPFAVAGFVIAIVAVTESRNPEGRALDVVGMVAVALGLLGITFGLIESSSHPWASLDVAGPLVVGVDPGGVLRPVGEPDVVAHAAAEPVAGPQLRLGLWRLPAHLPGAGRGHVLRHAALPGRGGLVTLPHRRVVAVDEHPVHRDRPVRRQAPAPLSACRHRGQRLPGRARSASPSSPCCRTPRRSPWRSSATCSWGSVGARWCPASSTSPCVTCPPGVSGGASGPRQRGPAGRDLGGAGRPRDHRGPCRHDHLGRPQRRRAGSRRTGAVRRRRARSATVTHALGAQYRPDAVAAFVSGYHLALLVAAGATLAAAAVAAVGLRSGAGAVERGRRGAGLPQRRGEGADSRA